MEELTCCIKISLSLNSKFSHVPFYIFLRAKEVTLLIKCLLCKPEASINWPTSKGNHLHMYEALMM